MKYSKFVAFILVGAPASGRTSVADHCKGKRYFRVHNRESILSEIAGLDKKFDKRHSVVRSLNQGYGVTSEAFTFAFASKFSNTDAYSHLILDDCVNNANEASVVAGVLESNGYLPVFVFFSCLPSNLKKRSVNDPMFSTQLIVHNEYIADIHEAVNRMRNVRKYTVNTDCSLSETLRRVDTYVAKIINGS